MKLIAIGGVQPCNVVIPTTGGLPNIFLEKP